MDNGKNIYRNVHTSRRKHLVQLIIKFVCPTADSSSTTIKITIELKDLDDEPPVIQNGGGILRTIPEDEGKQVNHLHLCNELCYHGYNANDVPSCSLVLSNKHEM
jgi:hypothetical protein